MSELVRVEPVDRELIRDLASLLEKRDKQAQARRLHDLIAHEE